LAELLSHILAAIDRYQTGEIDAYAVDETIHYYHRAATELWKFCFTHDGGHPRQVHRRPPRPHDRQHRSNRLVGTRPHRDDPNDHDRAGLPLRCRGLYGPWPLLTTVVRAEPP
jgi:hypothetical protein